MLKGGKSSAKELSSKWERWQFYTVVWEGVTEKVISERRLKVVRDTALWSLKEKQARQREHLETPGGGTLSGLLRDLRKATVAREGGPRGSVLGREGRGERAVNFNSSERDETSSRGMISSDLLFNIIILFANRMQGSRA